MRTQIAKTGYLPAEYIPPTFWLVYPLPLFRRLTVGAAIEKNFFWFFSILVWILVSTLFFRLSYLIISTRLKFVILYSILFFGISIVSTRYKFCSIFTRLRFLYSLLNFDLFQHCRFYALTLQLFISLTFLLVINKHLCLREFVLCLFWLF